MEPTAAEIKELAFHIYDCDVRDLPGPEKKQKRQSSSKDVKRH